MSHGLRPRATEATANWADACGSRKKLVTSEMRQAGASVLTELSGVLPSEDLAERIYSAIVHKYTHVGRAKNKPA